MWQRLSTTGIYLLVVLVVLVALTGCERSAQEREAQATEGADLTTPGVSDSTPQPGTTVVSAVSPAPGGATPIPTVESGVGASLTPAAPGVEPTATTSVIPAPQATATSLPGDQQEEVVYHTVQRGDTVYSIARRYGSTVEAITQANNLVNPSQIYAGQKLAIPTTSSGTSGGTQPPSGATGCRIKHTVKAGEWVWQIARNYGVSPYDILAANGMTAASASTVVPGQVLCIP